MVSEEIESAMCGLRAAIKDEESWQTLKPIIKVLESAADQARALEQSCTPVRVYCEEGDYGETNLY